jgi:hypothetical protein
VPGGTFVQYCVTFLLPEGRDLTWDAVGLVSMSWPLSLDWSVVALDMGVCRDGTVSWPGASSVVGSGRSRGNHPSLGAKLLIPLSKNGMRRRSGIVLQPASQRAH